MKSISSRLLSSILMLFVLMIVVGMPLQAGADDTKALQDGHQAYTSGQFKKSFSVWKPLAEKGNAQAQFYLSTLYSNGEGVDQDIFSALSWLNSSAQSGYPAAQFNLGNRYYHGRWVEQDRAKAAQWWRKAAEQGVTQASYNLGSLYYHGQGLPKNMDEALRWYRKAAGSGSEEAKKVLAKLDHMQKQPPPPPPSSSVIKPEPVQMRQPLKTVIPKPKRRAASAASANVSTPSESAAWIKSQPGRNYTIQVFAANKLVSVERYIRSFNATERIAVFGFVRAGTPYYAVVQGTYPNKAAADVAAKKLMVSTYVRSFRSIQKIMAE